MASAGSRRGFTGQASKQLAGEWEPLKEKEILIQWYISQCRSHFYNLLTSLALSLIPLSLPLNNTTRQSTLSHFTQKTIF